MLQIKVPPLGESIVEATVSRWLKKEGEPVAASDTLVDLETDKITVEVPAPRAGALSRIVASEGTVLKVGDLLAEFDDSVVGAEVGSSVGSGAGGGTSTANARLISEPAEKTTAGGLREAAHAVVSPPPAPSSAGISTAPATPASNSPSVATAGDGANVKSSPAARRAAAEAGIDVAGVTGTGRGGVVSKPDVLESAASSPKTAPIPTAPPTSTAPTSTVPPTRAASTATGERETREKMSTRRKRIAENLLQSQHSTAHLTTFNEIDMSAVNALRERMRERIEKEHGVKLTFMPFFVKAACMALETYPIVNAQVDGDSIIYKHYVNIGIAVASDAGLVVPNIKDAHAKGIIQIGRSTPIINYPQVGILGLHKTQDRPVAIDGKVEIRPMMYVALSYDHRIVEGQHAVLFLVRVKELIEDPAAMLIS